MNGREPMIRLWDVEKTYAQGPARVHVLRRITLDIAEGRAARMDPSAVLRVE